MRELEEIIIPYLKSLNDLEKVKTSLTKPTVKNLVLESRVRRVVYSNVNRNRKGMVSFNC
jgi:hypothetical protein